MNDNIKNVAIYCRVSTDEQKKFGLSVQDQKDSLTRYCKENKLKIYDYYIDGGVSAGTISKRKELVRLLHDLDNVDLIIFTKLDRFSRNVRDANNLLVELEKHHCSFRAIDEDDIDTSTSDGKFIFNLKVNLAERERNKDSERINRVNKYKFKTARTVCSGAKIFGYDISKDKRLIPNEVEVKQLNDLYDFYIQTNRLNATVRWFNANVKKRSRESVRLYLTNTAYIGKYKHIRKKTKEVEIIEGFSPAIISEEKFYKVQEMLKINVKEYTKLVGKETGNKTDYIFSGMLYCKCGKKLSGKHSKGKHYYVCKREQVNLCDNRLHISEYNLEDFILKNIERLIEEEINRNEVENIVSQLDNKNELLNKKNKIKNNLNKLTNLYLDDSIDIDLYKKKYAELKQELDCIDKNISSFNSNKDFTRLKEFMNSNWLSIYNTLENKEKRELLFSVIDKITFNSKEDFKIEFKLY